MLRVRFGVQLTEQATPGMTEEVHPVRVEMPSDGLEIRNLCLDFE
jgi:hypothetical protein